MNFGSFRQQVLRNAAEHDRTWVYRGHAEPSWPVESSYSRFHGRFGTNGPTPFDLQRLERMLGRFIAQASEMTGTDYDSYSVFQQMALAQHHGVPTPMLDWSHSPYVAVYFAVAGAHPATEHIRFCVHALDASQLPTLTLVEEARFGLDDPQPLLFIDTTSFFSRRITRQLGCFTYQRFAGCLRAWAGSTESAASGVELRTYQVDAERSQVMMELELMGITGGNLFDDLDYLAQDVVDAELAR